MDSEAAHPVALSSTQGPPAPSLGSILIRAPLSSHEEEEGGDPSAALSSPLPSSTEDECFLSGEDDCEFETASEQPFVPEPDEESVLEDDFGGPTAEPESPTELSGERASPLGFFLRKPPASMPKARLSGEEEDVAEEEFDEGAAGDVDVEAPRPLVARVAPSPGGDGVGDSVLVGGGGGVLEESGGDDDEKEAEDVRVSEEVSSGGDTTVEVSTDGGVPGYEEAAAAMKGAVVKESTDQEPTSVNVVGEETLPAAASFVVDEVSKDGMPHENTVVDEAAAAELCDSMGPGDGSATGVEDAGEEKVADLGDGEEEGAIPDAAMVRDSEVVKLQSSFEVVINGADEKAGFDGECEKGGGSSIGTGEEEGSVTQAVLEELKPDEAKSEASAEEGGTDSGAASDDNLETGSTQELQPSDTKETIGYTEEEEEKALDSSETTEIVGQVERKGLLKVVDISADSGGAECSLQKPDQILDIGEVADESVPSEPNKDGDEIEQHLQGGTGQVSSSVTQVAVELKSDEAAAESEVTAEETEACSGSSFDDNLETVGADSAVNVGTLELQSSETEDTIWHTEEKEHKVLDSSETKETVGEVETNDALKVVNISVDSGDAEYTLGKAGHLDRIEGADEIVPTQPKKERDEVEQASAELQVSSKEAKLNIDANGNDVYSEREMIIPGLLAEDSVNEKTDTEVASVLEAPDNGNTFVISVSDSDLKKIDDSSQDTDGEEHIDLNEGEKKSVVTDDYDKVATLGTSETAKQIIKETEEGPSGTSSRLERSLDFSNRAGRQIVSDSEEEMETDEEGDGKELFDSAALAALLKAATGASSDGNATVTPPDATRIFFADRPAGLGSSAAALTPAPTRTTRPNFFSPSDLTVVGEPQNTIDEEEKKLHEKVEQIRVKFLRLVHRLGHSPEDRVAAQVLYRLGLAEGIRRGRQIGSTFSFENAKNKALQLEENEKETLDFSCNILVIGKTGVGKSATINSIFGEEKVDTDAFEPATTSVKKIVGTVDGIKIHVIDTPGLRPSVMDQMANKKILASIKKQTKRCPPDIVLYVDRLDTQSWDFNDLPLLRSIASTLGSSIWFNAIIALTHAASAPPDGPNGSPLSYEVFVDQRSRVVQHAIRQASGDMRLMNPVALVENHPSCRRNREGQRVLPNGLSWRTQLLLLCYSSKILSDANSLLKLQDTSPGKLFGFRVRSPPLPFLLSSLLQSRVHPKLSTDQGVDNGDSDIDLGDLSDSDQEEEENEYDQLPPFKPLRKAQIAKLTKEQRKAYFDEYDYRVKLLQKKQWKEELRRLKEMKKRGKESQGESEFGDMVDDYDQDGAPATVPVTLPDMVLPPSFDCDNPAYRYRFLEPTSQLIVRPVLDTHGWDHDCGYDGVSLEENLAIASRFPAGISVQITKDKKDFNIHLDSSVSAKHGENGSTLAGFDIQSVGKQLAYILRSETKFRNLKKNKTAAGISVTFLGESVATGLKVEDQLIVGKRLGLVASTGAVRAQGDMAYGANVEVRLREKDFPIGQEVSTLGLSLMRWRGDLALGTNLQSQFSVGRNTKVAVRVGLNNKRTGQITVRTSTSEQLQIALLGILPIAVSIYRSIWSGESY